MAIEQSQNAVAGPSTTSKGPSRYQQNLKKYGSPLPILIPHPLKEKSIFSVFTSAILPQRKLDAPCCIGTYDTLTRSVWVTNREDMDVLFQRGFFGKGQLSRSEATWRERRLDLVKGGDSALAEQIRAKRRIERKAFKLERAEAMLQAAKTAEAVITNSLTQPTEGSTNDENILDDLDEEKSQISSMVDGPVDISTLTPQTYLVRPTRPDTNRNRGRKAFKRKPPPASNAPQDQSVEPAKIVKAIERIEEEEEGGSEDELFDEALVEEMEALQLTLEEAWFLAASLGVLRIYDPSSASFPPLPNLLSLLLTPTSPFQLQPTLPKLYPDDPFLISYVAYHHYRSLGWVVKPGIKFSCDWLLYKRGPVFSHSAFSLLIIPVFEDEAESEGESSISPYRENACYAEKQSWKWINTVMRVNSLVQKTVILVYITVPSLSSFPDSHRCPDGSLNIMKTDMIDLLKRYSVREVSLTRFGPARRRD